MVALGSSELIELPLAASEDEPADAKKPLSMLFVPLSERPKDEICVVGSEAMFIFLFTTASASERLPTLHLALPRYLRSGRSSMVLTVI